MSVYHHTWFPCVSECRVYFNPTLQANAQGATFQPGVTTQDTCLTQCEGSNSCVAADFNYGDTAQQITPQCWYHTDYLVQPNSNMVENITHFRQRAMCDVPSGGNVCTYLCVGLLG